jgi:hypothetical protein
MKGLDAWLTREPSVHIDPHAPWSAWKTEGMFEPEVPAQAIKGDPDDEAECIDCASFEEAEHKAVELNAAYPQREHDYDAESEHSQCSICGEPSPATEARWKENDDRLR